MEILSHQGRIGDTGANAETDEGGESDGRISNQSKLLHLSQIPEEGRLDQLSTYDLAMQKMPDAPVQNVSR
jgi:hypothetical protein